MFGSVGENKILNLEVEAEKKCYILFVYTGGLLRSEFSASAEGDGWAYGAAIEMHESASGWWIKGTSKWLLLSE